MEVQGPGWPGPLGLGWGALQHRSHQKGRGASSRRPVGPHRSQLQGASALDPAATWTSSRLRSSHLLYWTLLSWGCMP